MNVDPGWVAAIAAVAAALIVGWQSWETRKSADAAQDAVVAANSALELNRQQAAEAVRARIDAATPAISVHLDQEPTWPPREPSGFGGEPQPLPYGEGSESMHVPRDGSRLISVWTRVAVINESSRHTLVDLLELFEWRGKRIATEQELVPGQRVNAWCVATRTLDQWIEVYRERERFRSSDTIEIGAVFYSDPADTGATDRWSLAICGTPVEPVPNLDGAWRVIAEPRRLSGEFGAIGTGTPLRTRSYYLSKSRDELLDEITAPTP